MASTEKLECVMAEVLLCRKEVQRRLRMSRSTVQRRLDAGRIPKPVNPSGKPRGPRFWLKSEVRRICDACATNGIRTRTSTTSFRNREPQLGGCCRHFFVWRALALDSRSCAALESGDTYMGEGYAMIVKWVVVPIVAIALLIGVVSFIDDFGVKHGWWTVKETPARIPQTVIRQTVQPPPTTTLTPNVSTSDPRFLTHAGTCTSAADAQFIETLLNG